MIDPPRLSTSATWLLMTDVDDTLLGNDAAFKELVALDRCSRQLVIVLNSSRPVDSVARSIEEYGDGWAPEAIVGALGTEVEIRGTRLMAWEQRFAGWDRGPIDRAIEAIGGRPHDAEYQTDLKASFAVPADMRREALDALRACGARYRVIVSGESNFDVIPADAGKPAPIEAVVIALGIGHHQTVTAGDSGNDIDLITAGDAGIAVGNATEELRSAIARSARVYQATTTHAAGIIEGLRYFGAPLREDRR